MQYIRIVSSPGMLYLIIPMLRRWRQPFSKISETAWSEVCINGPGHMTKMAVMPFMVKTLQISQELASLVKFSYAYIKSKVR